MPIELIRPQPEQAITLEAITVFELLSKLDRTDISIAKVVVNGKNKQIINPVSDAFYYVISGAGVFTVDGQVFDVETGDLITIPKGTKYSDQGEMELLAINTPAFDADVIIYLDRNDVDQ